MSNCSVNRELENLDLNLTLVLKYLAASRYNEQTDRFSSFFTVESFAFINDSRERPMEKVFSHQKLSWRFNMTQTRASKVNSNFAKELTA